MIWLLTIPLILLIALLVVDFRISAPGHEGPKSDHFNGIKFFNPDHVRGHRLFDMAKWAVTGKKGAWKNLMHHEITDWNGHAQNNPAEIKVTFVNHSTFLVQMGRINLLTDPVWAERVSPYSWVGPRRMRPPGIKFNDLPPVDLVLLSHNHYDHLDIHSIHRLQKEHDPLFVVPLGVEQYLLDEGIPKTIELDWWKEDLLADDISLTCVPARHFSGRGVFDRDRTLWCGYVLQIGAGTLYFAGDTAYGDFFTDIGESFDIDVSLIPVGAYKPRWFMRSIHADPEEAVQIHQDVQSTRSIGSHFGTFPLADEAMDEPLQDLEAAREKYGVGGSEFITLDEGVSFSFSPSPQSLSVAGE